MVLRRECRNSTSYNCPVQLGFHALRKLPYGLPSNVLISFTTQYTLSTTCCMTSQTRLYQVFVVVCFFLFNYSVIPVFSQYQPLQLFSFPMTTGELLLLYRMYKITCLPSLSGSLPFASSVISGATSNLFICTANKMDWI